MNKIVEVTCPGCGGKVDLNMEYCKYCHQPIVFSKLKVIGAMESNSIDKNIRFYLNSLKLEPNNYKLSISLGLCYLKLKMYDKAIEIFNKIIDNSIKEPDILYYLSICLLRGKKAFVNSRKDIDRAIEYLNAAIGIEEKGDYYYLLAYIKFDYFYRKSLRSEPNFIELKTKADLFRFSENEKEELFKILNVMRPIEM